VANASDTDNDNSDEHDIFPAIDDTPPEGRKLNPIKPVVGEMEDIDPEDKQVIRLEVPIRTIVTIIGAIFGVWLILQINQILLLIFVALLLTLALVPPVAYLESRGLPRIAAAGVCFLGLIGVIVGFFAIIVPPLIEQGNSVVDNFPTYTQNLERFIERYPALNERYQDVKENGLGEDVELPWSSVIAVGVGAAGRVLNTFFVLVLTFYLLIEGKRAYGFLARYATPRLRYRLRRLFPELTRVVSGYVIGQLINSTIFAVFTFTLLTIMDVPEALLLAMLAFVLDAVPIIGAPVATVPAVLLAATVSPTAAIVVLIAYIAYQQFENYVLVPRVFGSTLQVSSLSILLGVLIGGQLLGVIGIILSLPITASIPVLERVWREKVPTHLTDEMI
jgi:predicted PurR-regulated permease PerM